MFSSLLDNPSQAGCGGLTTGHVVRVSAYQCISFAVITAADEESSESRSLA